MISFTFILIQNPNPNAHIPDLDVDVASLVVLLNVDVDGKVSVDVSHLVLVALRYTDDQVVDVGADGSEGGDVLAGAVVDLDVDDILLGLGEVDSQVAQVLDKFACCCLLVSPSRLELSSSMYPARCLFDVRADMNE